MRFILFVLGSIFLFSLHINCRSGAKHPITLDEDKRTTIDDTIQRYAAEVLRYLHHSFNFLVVSGILLWNKVMITISFYTTRRSFIIEGL
jgi:hypothetical protein